MLNPYEILSTSEIVQIHESSLQILKKVGMKIDHPLAQEKLLAAGASLNKDKNRLTFPEAMVKKALATAKKEFICAGQDPKFDLTMKQGLMPKVRMGAGCISHYDLKNNQSRPLTIQDNIEAVRLVEALDHIDIAAALTPYDLPLKTYDIHVTKNILNAGRKHFWALTTHSTHLKYQLELLEIVAGSKKNLQERPLASGIVCTITPLKIPADEIERLLLYGQYNIPVRVPLTAMMGANAPYTLAGALTQINAEFLGALLVIQTLCPGLPVWYYCLLSMMDMRRGYSVFNNPEVLLLYGAVSQLARNYDIPSCVSSPSVSCCQSHQLMAHLGSAQVFSSMVNVSEIGGAGALEGANHFSPEALVLTDEIMAFSKRMVKGININEDTLGVQAITETVEKGEYVSSPHTMKFLREESRFKPNLMDWQPHETWINEASTIIDRAHDRSRKLIETHEVPPLDEAVQRELDKVVELADQELLS